MEDLQRQLSQNFFSRGCWDSLVRLGSPWFWVAELIWGGLLSEQGLGPWEVVAGMFILAGVVLVAAIATAPIRQRDDLRKYAKTLIPEVELEFIQGRGGIVETPIKVIGPVGNVAGEQEATYIRVGVTACSRKTVHNCEPYLCKIEKKNSNGEFTETKFIDPIKLPWSLAPQPFEPKNIYYPMRRFFDVIYCKETTKEKLFFPDGVVHGLTMRTLFDDHTTYRFMVLVVGEGVSETLSLDLDWDGKRKNMIADEVK